MFTTTKCFSPKVWRIYNNFLLVNRPVLQQHDKVQNKLFVSILNGTHFHQNSQKQNYIFHTFIFQFYQSRRSSSCQVFVNILSFIILSIITSNTRDQVTRSLSDQPMSQISQDFSLIFLPEHSLFVTDSVVDLRVSKMKCLRNYIWQMFVHRFSAHLLSSPFHL